MPHEVDTPLYAIAEILGSILCSSYHFYGGYNAHLAGGSNFATRGEDDPVWYNGATAYLERLQWGQGNPGLIHLQDQFRNLALARDLPARRQRRVDAETACHAAEERLKEAKAAYARLRKEMGRLQGELDQSNALSPSDRERQKKERQRQEILEILTLGRELGEDFVDDATAEIEDFDEDLFVEVLKEYTEAHTRCMRKNREARERRRKERRRNSLHCRLESFRSPLLQFYYTTVASFFTRSKESTSPPSTMRGHFAHHLYSDLVYTWACSSC